MDQQADFPRETYFAEARGWALDRRAAEARGARLAWIVAGVSVTLALVEGLALIALAPLKTVVPYTLLVDRNTGFVQVLEGNRAPPVARDTALAQSLLAQYVIAREGYDNATVAEQYQRVALWSAGGARDDYLAAMRVDNPDGPVARLGRAGVVAVRVESVSRIAADTAMVRFATERHDGGGSGPAGGARYWVAVVRYRFSGEPMRMEDRLVNPLGFQVVQYRRDQEAPPAVADAAGADHAARADGGNAEAAPATMDAPAPVSRARAGASAGMPAAGEPGRMPRARFAVPPGGTPAW